MTGRLPHNYEPLGQTGCLQPEKDSLTIFPKLADAGYRVGLFGKHMNKAGMTSYCPKHRHSHGIMPSGVSHYMAMCPDTCYQDCVFAVGTTYGGLTKWEQPTAHQGYHTAIIGNHSLEFIRNAAWAQVPFMLYVAPHAPHLPCTPAPWYTDAPVARGAPRDPAFNASAPDKHWIVAQQPPLSAWDITQIDGVFRNRTRTLFSVDDLVHDTVGLLVTLGIDNHTYVIFTSDHGFHLGHFRLGTAKRQWYDTDLRVPLLIRGPGLLAGGSMVPRLSSHVDLAPTILHMAGLAAEKGMDGASLLPLIESHEHGPWRTSVYVEYQAEGKVGYDWIGHMQCAPNNTFIAIRSIDDSGRNDAYAEFTKDRDDWSFDSPDFVEMYDVHVDPHQLTNLVRTAAPGKVIKLRQELHRMLHCGAGVGNSTCFQPAIPSPSAIPSSVGAS